MSPAPNPSHNPGHKGQSTVLCPVCGLELPSNLKKCPQDGVALTTSMPLDPLVGTIVGGRYEILSMVGRGGMSVVYKARNRAVGSIVAVKTLKQDLVSDEELFARFCQEAKAVQMMINPNIVSVHEFGVTLSGQPFIVMDYLEGQTLADVLEEEGRIPVKRMLPIFIQVADALAHAHTHKIIHRDIKPGNIMLITQGNDSDVVKLFDFGFCKFLPQRGVQQQALTQAGDVLGTPLYMSPEQSRGKPLDSRSDIYSLGCVMYEALTGKAPIIGENVLDTMQKHVNEAPQALETARPDLYIPEALTAVLFKTLEKDANNRYQSISDLKRDLELINNAVAGKTTINKGALPGLAKLKKLPEKKERKLPANAIKVSVAALVAGAAVWGYMTYVNPSNGMRPYAISSLLDNPDVAWAKYRQAGLQASQRYSYGEAEDLLELALKCAERSEEPDDRTATTLVDLGRVYLTENKLSDADKATSKALLIRQKLGELNAIQCADVFICRGELCLARENYKGAIDYFQKALSIQQRELGTTHQDLGTTYNLMGRAAEAEQSFGCSEGYYKQALAIRQTALGPNKLPVAETLSDYARLLRRMNRGSEAAKAEERARTIRSGAAAN